MVRIVLFFTLSLFFQNATAQSLTDDLIVNIEEGKSEVFLKNLPGKNGRASSTKLLSKDLSIYLLEASSINIDYINHSPFVESWGYDRETKLRGIPNDMRYNTQWGLQMVNAANAWDNNTGGTFDGKHDIVIAVLDDGFDVTHTELIPNTYINIRETPNNGIDDDANGYVDDYRGLNIETGNDQHESDDHGTAVAGIIGAKGNNGEGLAGIMWDVKMLYVSEVSRQSELIESFQYIINLRRQWNQSEGEEGAFIVATNYSAGIDNALGTDPEYKSWCDMYDLLGEVGILSAGATANRDTNVDTEGDMPTTCPSDYLISVTNIGFDDVKVSNAGYGSINIDLGAPGGTDTSPMPVLDEGQTYGTFNGTSSATPHVAGSIGLLYGINCTEFINQVYNSPATAAARVKNAILNSTDINSSLQGITSTNGRLNIERAINNLAESCDQSVDEARISSISYDEDTFTVMYTNFSNDNNQFSVVNTAGATLYSGSISALDINTTGSFVVQRPELIPGIYYFSIYNDKQISTKPVIISD